MRWLSTGLNGAGGRRCGRTSMTKGRVMTMAGRRAISLRRNAGPAAAVVGGDELLVQHRDRGHAAWPALAVGIDHSVKGLELFDVDMDRVLEPSAVARA